MVKVDWKLICWDVGEPVEKLPEVAMPLASVPDGPVTAQESTSLAVQDMVEELPERKRAGFALIETSGDDTVTVVFAMAEPPGLVQVTL